MIRSLFVNLFVLDILTLKLANIEVDRINFLIPDYRDILCDFTIHSIFRNAANPSRIFVYIIQELFDEDSNALSSLLESEKVSDDEKNWIRRNIIILSKPAEEQKGLFLNVWQAEKLMLNRIALFPSSPEVPVNDFMIRMDAHSSMLLNYDNLLIKLFDLIGDEMGVLSSYPLPLSYQSETLTLKQTDDKKYFYEDHWGKICLIKQNDNYLLYMPVEITDSTKTYPCFKQKGYCKGFFTPGGFFFSKVTVAEKVPHDPYLTDLFNGEQILFSLRLFASGYNIYIPSLNFVFHKYGEGWFTRAKVNKNKVGNGDAWVRSVNRYKYIMGIRKNYSEKNAELREIKKYGAGNVRTVQEFYDMIGIAPNDLLEIKDGQRGTEASCKKMDEVNNRF